jgi:hypothetical protein
MAVMRNAMHAARDSKRRASGASPMRLEIHSRHARAPARPSSRPGPEKGPGALALTSPPLDQGFQQEEMPLVVLLIGLMVPSPLNDRHSP